MRVRRLLASDLSALCLCLPFAAAITAQQSAQQSNSTSSSPYVLHVYANLVQVPTLALTSKFQPLLPVAPDRFSIRLDSGPVFHPTKMHIEGDEPISLIVLLDASGDEDRLLRSFAPAFAQMAQSSLRPHDHVSIFAVDCTLVRSTLEVTTSTAALQNAVSETLSSPLLHRHAGRASCGRSLRLWDAAVRAIADVSNVPGRKVMLLVSSGNDHRSDYNWNALKLYASGQSVAIFGLRDYVRFAGDYGVNQIAQWSSGIYYAPGTPVEDNYNELCQNTGGLIFTTVQQDLVPTLQRLVSMIRGRYILEFPRPDDSSPGRHVIDVTLPSEASFIVTAGVTVALPDANRNADPTTVPSSPSPALMGKRHPLDHN